MDQQATILEQRNEAYAAYLRCSDDMPFHNNNAYADFGDVFHLVIGSGAPALVQQAIAILWADVAVYYQGGVIDYNMVREGLIGHNVGQFLQGVPGVLDWHVQTNANYVTIHLTLQRGQHEPCLLNMREMLTACVSSVRLADSADQTNLVLIVEVKASVR